MKTFLLLGTLLSFTVQAQQNITNSEISGIYESKNLSIIAVVNECALRTGVVNKEFEKLLLENKKLKEDLETLKKGNTK